MLHVYIRLYEGFPVLLHSERNGQSGLLLFVDRGNNPITSPEPSHL